MDEKSSGDRFARYWVFGFPLAIFFIYLAANSPEFEKLASKWLDKLANDPLELFTLVLAISTGFLWRETYGLRKLGSEQAADTERSLAIAKQAADAATLNAKSLERLEQPFLFIATAPTIEYSRIDTDPVIRVHVGNYGRAPAIIMWGVRWGAGCIPKSANTAIDCDQPLNWHPPIFAPSDKDVPIECPLPPTIHVSSPEFNTRLIPQCGADEVFVFSLEIEYMGMLNTTYVYMGRWLYDPKAGEFLLSFWGNNSGVT